MQSNETLAQPPVRLNDLPKGIIILGAAKSGTTALFYAIRKALAAASGIVVEGLFEPRQREQVEEYISSTRDQVFLVKGLLGPLLRHDARSLNDPNFSKKIIIYRDPRDNVVSRICFMLPKLVGRDQQKIEQVMGIFREKEKSPDSISVVSMVRQIAEITGRADLLQSVRENALLPAKMKRERDSIYFFMPYDDLVSERFDRLSEYLGFAVTGDFEVDRQHSYVVRSKSSGAWRNWFLDEDVEFFSREVGESFRILDFDPDESPHEKRAIAPATSSEYVASLFKHVQEKRAQSRARKRERALAAAAEQSSSARSDGVLDAQRKPQAPEFAVPDDGSRQPGRDRPKLTEEQRRQRRLRRKSRQTAAISAGR